MVEAVSESGISAQVYEVEEKECSLDAKTQTVAEEVSLAKPQETSLVRAVTTIAAVQTGSMLTTAEEAANLAADATVSAAIQASSKQYDEALSNYRAGSTTYADLQKDYATIFGGLLVAVQEAIAKDTTGKISPIAKDYDAAHQEAYAAHLESLIGEVQNSLKIPPYQCLLPPNPAYPNLLKNGDFSQGTADWSVTAGSATLKVNSPDPFDKTSPVENLNSLSFVDMAPKPGYVTVSQSIPTTPGRTYLVSGYIYGAPVSGSNGALPAGMTATGVRTLTSTITGKTNEFPQATNSLYTPGLQSRYFWVQATGSEMAVSVYGGPEAVFKNISVVDVTGEDPTQVAQTLVPPTITTGDPQVGHYPQVERKLQAGDNLIDGPISIQKNIDETPLGSAGHPYWYFDSHNVANQGIKITNAQNGDHGLYLPTNASVTTNGPLPCPIGNYTYTMFVYLPQESTGKINVQLNGTSLIDGAHMPKVSSDFDNLTPGQTNAISMPIDPSFLAGLPKGAFFSPSFTITNTGGPSTIFGTSLTSPDATTYDQINRINPYSPDRSWYAPEGSSKTYDFTKGAVDLDWGMALAGNTMFSPGSPADEYTKLTSEGIEIISTRDHTKAPPYSNGGIQSTQLIPSGKNFSISMQFSATTDSPDYEPTLALWTYGESQRGPNSPLTHTNAPGSDPITEFDCEMGSDISKNTPPPAGTVYARDGSYIGHAEGGHSEYIDTDSKGTPEWKAVPDFWDGKSHTLTMEATYNPQGRLILTRTLDGKQFSQQDLGTGPFSPMYVKIALENPTWNSRGETDGNAKVTIQNVSVKVQPATDLEEDVTIPTIPTSDIDFAWFTPGGGGGVSYTPFPLS